MGTGTVRTESQGGRISQYIVGLSSYITKGHKIILEPIVINTQRIVRSYYDMSLFKKNYGGCGRNWDRKI